MGSSGLWSVVVTDNFHLHDDEAHTTLDGFGTEADAIARARQVVRESLLELHVAGMTAEELVGMWSGFGDGAFVVGPGPGWRSTAHVRALAEAICA